MKLCILSCLYPNKCAGCDGIIDEGKDLCEYCRLRINNVNYGKLCLKCGLQKEYCRCAFREFRFRAALGVFKNDGIARMAYYSYKLGKNEKLAAFFAQKAARAVKTVFADVSFDAVVCVPTAHRSKLKRGFDHNEGIALRLANFLGVKYLRGALKAKHFRPLQHKSSFSKRLENVRGKYYTDKRINLDRVLLFDDISTTGATLDECAKELMFAGVKEVYCVTVLATYPKKRINGGK
ncbi:MAG: ComF family protein [Clostridia bacterium]|nr:ComF family protein [Clostridia bacterium]